MDRPLGCLAKVRFQLGKCLFDRVDIRALGRQEQERGAGALDAA
jgi:hypothetical protein